MKFRYITPLLAAVGAAAGVAGTPIAAAESTSTQQSCSYVSGSGDTQCQSPGNVQINDAPPPVQYTPQYPYWEGR